MAKKQQKAGDGAATIHDVARRAGVSIKTVSRVINGEPHVRAQTAERVQDAVRELNYRPNLSARSLSGTRSYQVALWSGMHDGGISTYYSAVQNSFVAACLRRRYGPVFDPIDPGSPDLLNIAVAAVAEKRPCGIVITPPFADYETLLGRLDNMGIAYTLVSPARESADRAFVTTDDEGAARAMTEKLIALGHSRIGFVSGHPDHGAAAKRQAGFLDALKRANIPAEAQLMSQGNFTFESGVESARWFLSRPEPPTAIFASNDDMAVGVLHHALDSGMRVPADLSVAGFDDTAIARYIFPSLTTVHQPIPEMIHAAVDYLVLRANGEAAGNLASRFPCSIVMRDSVGPVTREGETAH